MKNQINIGAIMLGSLLASASFPARGQEGATDPQNQKVSAPEKKPGATSPLSEIQLEEKIQDLKADLIRFNELAPEEQKNPKILLAALKDPENSHDAILTLKTEDYESREIREAVAERVNLESAIFDQKGAFWGPILAHPLARTEIFGNVIHEVAFDSHAGESQYLFKIVEQFAPADTRDSLNEKIRSEVRSSFLDPSVVRPMPFLPEFLRQDKEVVAVFLEQVKNSATIYSYKGLTELGLSDAQCRDLYKEMRRNGKAEFEDLIFHVPDQMLMEDWRQDYLGLLRNGTRQAVGRLNDNLVSDKEISDTAKATLRSHPELMNALKRRWEMGIGEASSFVQEFYREVLSDKRQLDHIVSVIAGNFSLIENIPDEILKHPRVSFNVRKALNEAILDGSASTHEDASFRLLTNRSLKLFPELLWLNIKRDDALAISDFAYNPRALCAVVGADSGKTVSIADTKRLLDLQKAAYILNITEFGRFDNAYELFRNRYQIATPEIQQKLRESLGEAYFKDIAEDSRPICVVVNPARYADHNGAFLSRIDSQVHIDTIDQLTSHYHVIYYEASDETELTRDMLSGFAGSEKLIDVLILGGHGHAEGVQLGHGHSLLKKGSGELDITDVQIFRRLGTLMKEGGRVFLESCSTAKDNGEDENVATVIHRHMPTCHVFAPKSDAGFVPEFNDDGELIGANYVYAREAHFKPDGTVETESWIGSIYSDISLTVSATARSMYLNPWDAGKTFLMVIGAQVLLAGTYRSIRSLFKSRATRRPGRSG